jgi:hypothetical protein
VSSSSSVSPSVAATADQVISVNGAGGSNKEVVVEQEEDRGEFPTR